MVKILNLTSYFTSPLISPTQYTDSYYNGFNKNYKYDKYIL